MMQVKGPSVSEISYTMTQKEIPKKTSMSKVLFHKGGQVMFPLLLLLLLLLLGALFLSFSVELKTLTVVECRLVRHTH